MSQDDYTPHGDHPASPELVQLRLRAEQLIRSEQDSELLTLVDQLRGDLEWWPHLWAPAAAVAVSRLGRDGGLDLLQSAIAGGFSQPELMEGTLEQHFGALAQWPVLVSQMAANVPPPPLVLLDWPDPGAAVPLVLFTIAPGRLDQLAGRLPDRRASAWETATTLLEWVRRRWEHANDHVDEPDAIDVLTRVEAGERFACVEYSIVLSQALNAAKIPARRVDLRQPNHHAGVGRGHVVSEAWIDDLDRWVLLDGQNGAYWVDAEGAPMGLRGLQRTCETGEPTRMVCLVDELSEQDQATWRTYFATASTTGYTWAAAGYSPIFQGMGITKTDRLLHNGELAYPQLSTVSMGLTGTVARPAVRLRTAHPYADGFRLVEGESSVDVGLADARWDLPMGPGVHEVRILTRTPYGVTHGCTLSYEVRGA